MRGAQGPLQVRELLSTLPFQMELAERVMCPGQNALEPFRPKDTAVRHRDNTDMPLDNTEGSLQERL